MNNKRLSQNDHIPLKSATVSHHFHGGKTKKIEDEMNPLEFYWEKLIRGLGTFFYGSGAAAVASTAVRPCVLMDFFHRHDS